MREAAIGDRVAEAIGRQLAHPSGVGGRVTAAIMRVANRRPTKALIDALGIRPEHCVLDVGCGDGSTLAALPHAALRCGVDQSTTMLTIARKKLRGTIAQGHTSLRRGDMLELPFDANSFDRILASNVLYFCRNVPAFINECRRVAKPGATLGIYLTSASSMAKWRFAGPATHRQFTTEQLEAELDDAKVHPGRRKFLPVNLPGGIEGLILLVGLS